MSFPAHLGPLMPSGWRLAGRLRGAQATSMVPLVVNTAGTDWLGFASDGLRSVTQPLLMTADLEFSGCSSLDQGHGVLGRLLWCRLDSSIWAMVVYSVMD